MSSVIDLLKDTNVLYVSYFMRKKGVLFFGNTVDYVDFDR